MKIKALIKKIVSSFKKAIDWIFKNIKYLILAAGVIVAILIYKKIKVKIGKVGSTRLWEPVKGDKTKVFVWNDMEKKIVDLPIDPKTGKQITSNDIKQIGLPDKITDEEVLHVEILHTPVNRR